MYILAWMNWRLLFNAKWAMLHVWWRDQAIFWGDDAYDVLGNQTIAFFKSDKSVSFQIIPLKKYILQITLFGDFIPSKYNAATPIFIMLYELYVRHTQVYSQLHNFPCTANIKFLSKNEFIVRFISGLFLLNVILPEIE